MESSSTFGLHMVPSSHQWLLIAVCMQQWPHPGKWLWLASKTNEAIHWALALDETWVCLPLIVKSGLSRLCGENHSVDSTDKKPCLSKVLWNMEEVMRHLVNQDHPLHLTVPSHLDLFLLLDLDSFGQWSEADICATLLHFHYNPSLVQVMTSHDITQPKSCGYEESVKQ